MLKITSEFGGWISAEHGIGIVKRPYLKMSRTREEIETMRTLKRALDPNEFSRCERTRGRGGHLGRNGRTCVRPFGKWRPNTLSLPCLLAGDGLLRSIPTRRSPGCATRSNWSRASLSIWRG
ncbi:hypothetical protein IVB07_32180 [Bradyrhizobium sp. 172]|nr:hypothetical protein IVB07_32180 [Bradyrhizobium sp. 172]